MLKYSAQPLFFFKKKTFAIKTTITEILEAIESIIDCSNQIGEKIASRRSREKKNFASYHVSEVLEFNKESLPLNL